MKTTLELKGSCHCGQVQFRVKSRPNPTVFRCSCSICRRNGFLHLIVPRSWLTIDQGQEALTEYRFGTGIAQHLFCSTCGVESFYVPRSNPDGYSVHVGCLEDFTEYTVEDFDGAEDYDAQVQRLAQLSKEDP